MKSVNGNPLLIKEVNRGIIRCELMKRKKATKKELSEETGLSVVTVNSILLDMMEEKEVVISESIPSNGGRPSQVYCYNADFRYALLIYAHQGKKEDIIKVRVVNLLKEVVYRKDYCFMKVTLTTFEPLIEEVLVKYPRIRAIGFGLPGEEHEGTITINDFTGIVGTRFLQHYREKFGFPVVLENDANAAAMGYCCKHNELEKECVAGICFLEKYPPGAGIVMKGKLYKGKSNFAGEVAKMPLGIDWTNWKNAGEEAAERIAKLAVAVSCVLAPEKIVIYSEPIGEAQQTKIKERYREMFDSVFETEIVFSENFEEEFEIGMIKITLELMEDTLILTKEGRKI